MSRFDSIGLFWQDLPSSGKRGERVLGPLPPIPETGWRPPTELPDLRRGASCLSFDVETYDPELEEHGPGWARGKGHICGISMATPDRKIYVPIRHEVQREMNLDVGCVLRWANDMLNTPDIPKVGANMIYDMGWLRQEGVTVAGSLHDVQFAEPLLDETSKVSLETLGQKYCGVGKQVDMLKEWILNYYGGSQTKWRKNIYRAPVTLVGAYGEQDAVLPLMIMRQQYPQLFAEGLINLFNMECKMIRILMEMRFAGVSVDLPYAEELRDRFVLEEAEVQKKINYIAGCDVNVNAAESLAAAFDKLGIPYPRTAATANKPNGNPSFVKEWLEHHDHPLAQAITELRGLAKLRGTFVEGYILGAHVNGKVHGSFHSMSGQDGGARTGRLSSSDPNLQNIPTRSKMGKLIRKAFIADAGHLRWRKYDYSQIEYRFLAHFAVGEGSDEIRQRYQSDPNTDYHQATMDLIKAITGIELERGPTKNINFGLIYGMGLDKLAKDLGLSIQAAKELITSYHTGVPFAKKTMEAVMAFVNEYGYNETILGRRTRFNLWEPAGWGMKGAGLPYHEAVNAYGSDLKRAYAYKALNYKLQGSAADMMKSAMVKCWDDGIFDATGIPRLTVHDELDFSDPGGRNDAFRAMREIMQNVMTLRVPVICDCDIGPNWGDVVEEHKLDGKFH